MKEKDPFCMSVTDIFFMLDNKTFRQIKAEGNNLHENLLLVIKCMKNLPQMCCWGLVT